MLSRLERHVTLGALTVLLAVAAFLILAPLAYSSGPISNVVAHHISNPLAPNYPCETIVFETSSQAEAWLRTHEGDTSGECPPVVIPPNPQPQPAHLVVPPNTDIVWLCMGDTGRLFGDVRFLYDKGQWFNNNAPTQNIQTLPAGTVRAKYVLPGGPHAVGVTCDNLPGYTADGQVDVTGRSDFTPATRATTPPITYTGYRFG